MIRLGKNKVVGMIMGATVFVLSSDLLYLYYAGSWVESNTFIRISELVFLYTFCLLGLIYMIDCYMALSESRYQLKKGRRV